MSREIKFRGKPIEDYGDIKWFYGSLIIDYEDKLAYIEANGQGITPVEFESVGQYIGLKDSYEKDVYVGDIILVTPHAGEDKSSYYGVFEFVPGGFQLKAPKERFPFGGGYVPFSHTMGMLCSMKVVGNIYENPELLEGADH